MYKLQNINTNMIMFLFFVYLIDVITHFMYLFIYLLFILSHT